MLGTGTEASVCTFCCLTAVRSKAVCPLSARGPRVPDVLGPQWDSVCMSFAYVASARTSFLDQSYAFKLGFMHISYDVKDLCICGDLFYLFIF